MRTLLLAFLFLFPTVLAASDCDRERVLALNMYHEARGDGPDGMIMVAEVTLNRVASNSYPDTICEVVYQRSQFSWTTTRLDHRPSESESWEVAVRLSVGILHGEINHFDTGATHFLNPSLLEHIPSWAEEFQVVGRVGDHVFYEM